MASHQSKAQKETVGRVMHEFKHGELERSRGGKVKNRTQAIAIALQEAGASKYESAQKNRENLKKTQSRERQGATPKGEKEGKRGGASHTRAELYAEAKRREVPGRSKMNKGELQRALHHA